MASIGRTVSVKFSRLILDKSLNFVKYGNVRYDIHFTLIIMSVKKSYVLYVVRGNVVNIWYFIYLGSSLLAPVMKCNDVRLYI